VPKDRFPAAFSQKQAKQPTIVRCPRFAVIVLVNGYQLAVIGFGSFLTTNNQ